MIVLNPLRQPMSLGELIANTWALYRLHFHDMVMMGSFSALPGLVATFTVTPVVTRLSDLARRQEEPLPREDWLLLIILGPPLMAVAYYTLAAIYLAALQAATLGRIGLGRSYVITLQRFPALAIAGVLSLLVPAALAGTLIGLPLALYLFVGWLVSPLVLLAEDGGPLRSLSRSRLLTKGAWWHACGVVLALIGLVLFLPTFVVFGIFGFLFQNELSQSLIGFVINALTTPFLAVGMALLYLDLRLRKGEPLGPAHYGAA